MNAYRELAALEAQCAALGELLDEIGPGDWDRPTRCPPLAVRELVVHVAAVLPVWASFFDGEPPAEPTSSRVEWWRYDVDQTSPRVVERAQRMASERTDDQIVPWFRANLATLLTAARGASADRLVGRSSVALTAADLMCVGAVEVGIHTMDISHALLKGERIRPEAVALAVEVIESLLGVPFPRKLGWDDKTKILTATGRRPLSQNERHTLGTLSERFPVFA